MVSLETAMDKFAGSFEKKFGEGTLDRRGGTSIYDVISTGSLDLDYKTGVGGLVIGKLYEIWGPNGSGKTTLCINICREAQLKFPTKSVFWVDMEHSFDKQWAIAHGMELENSRAVIYPPESAEDVADAIKEAIRSGLFSVVVLDSIGAMITEEEKEKPAEKATMAAKPKVVTRMVNIACPDADKTDTTVVMINQVRANLAYGADTTTSGGFALKHCTTMKFKMSRTGTLPFMDEIKGVKEVVGHEIRVKIERNRVAPADRIATITMFNQPSQFGPIGIDKVDEAITVGVANNIIEQPSVGYFILPTTGEKIHGRGKLVDAMRADPESVQYVRDRLLESVEGEIIEDNEILLEEE